MIFRSKSSLKIITKSSFSLCPRAKKSLLFGTAFQEAARTILGPILIDYNQILRLFLNTKWSQKQIFQPPEGQIRITFRDGLARSRLDSPGIDFTQILTLFCEAFFGKKCTLVQLSSCRRVFCHR